jgi:CHAT domain-containing protein
MTMRRFAALCLCLSLSLLCTVGAAQQGDIEAIRQRVLQFNGAGDYAAAYVEVQRMQAAVKARFGTDHLNYATVLNILAGVISDTQGRHAEAEALYGQVLSIYERALAKHLAPTEALHLVVAETFGKTALEQVRQGKYAEAEGSYRRALPMLEHGATSSTCSRLKNVWSRGEPCGLANQDLGTLNNLAVLYVLQGKYAEAEGFHKRALEIFERASHPSPDDVAYVLDRLAIIKRDQGKYAEAEGLQKRALAIFEQAYGANHVVGAYYLNNLGTVLRLQGKYTEAEGLHRRALAKYEQALGANEPHVAEALNELALVIQAQGRYTEAEGLYQRALANQEQALGAKHPDVAATLNNLALLYVTSGNISNALMFSRRASAAVIAHTLSETGNAEEQHADYFRNHVATLALAARQGIGPERALGVEGFDIAQWASQSSAAAALQQTAVRFASGSGALATLVRESQDLAAQRNAEDKLLIAALSRSDRQQDRAAIERVRKEIAEIDGRIAAISARLEKDFPDYAALASPKPLHAEEAQKVLGADEALVFYLMGGNESYIFALTRESFIWRTIPIGAKDLLAKIAAFRHGLDVGELRASIDAGKPVLFDLGLAHELYTAVIEPVETLVNDKPPLLVVPTGALTSLPFHLLVTEKPATPVPQLEDITAYRDAAWLIKRQAVSVLPSVASLQALQVFVRREQGTKPMVGFGDPVFDPAERAKALAERRRRGRTVVAKARGYSEFWQGVGVDRTRLAQALPSLLDTADELKAVAAKLGAPAADIHLDKDATETMVKRTALENYRVVYFATHGLVAGDVKGLGEPSLALTLPAQPSNFDDGLLTASEVAQLKLNADWVVLSACNTAAGDKPGAEALSGLARAFFYAGARALLVSHWSVASDAATRLTTSTFGIMNSDPAIGRAEALRRSMLAYMNDASAPLNAYPAFWAPFEVVGEGTAR